MKFLLRIWNVLRWGLLAILVMLALLWAFHPPLVRWAVRTYSPEHTGRRITLEHFRFHPLTTSVDIRGLQVLEAEGDSVFLSVRSLYVNSSLVKALGGFYEVSALHVSHPYVRIVQSGTRFNFSDLIDRFAGDSTQVEDEETTGPVRYAVHDVRVDSLAIDYSSPLLPTPLSVAHADLTCPQVKWDVALIEALVTATMTSGADIEADVRVDQERLTYAAHVQAGGIHWRLLEPYIEPYMHLAGMTGTIDMDLALRGDAEDDMDFALKGVIGTSGFGMLDPDSVKILGLERFDLVIDTADVKAELYRVRRMVLDEPYVFAELYDSTDNFTRLLVETDSAGYTEAEEELGYDPENPFSILAHYVKLVAENYATMNYKVDSVGVYDGTVIFNDFTLEQPFHYELTDLTLTADDINSGAEELVLRTHAVLNEDGTLEAELGLDPHSLRNMRLAYTVEQVGMPDFGPYTVHYVAHPILSGRTRYVCNTTIIDNQLQSENHILVEDFQFGKKMDITDAYNLPVRLAVGLMKDKDGNIDLKVPVEGDLDDPEYKVWPIVWQVLKNLVVKAVTAPAALIGRALGADEDDLKAVRFLALQETIGPRQEKPLNTLTRVVNEKPDLAIELVQTGDRQAEAEAYAIRTAKAAYYVDSTGHPIDTAVADLDELLEGLDIRSPAFLAWMDAQAGPSDAPIQRRCMQLIGETNAATEVERLWAVRRDLVTNYLSVEKELPAGSFLVRDRLDTDTIPTMGQPSFHVLYGVRDEVATQTP